MRFCFKVLGGWHIWLTERLSMSCFMVALTTTHSSRLQPNGFSPLLTDTWACHCPGGFHSNPATLPRGFFVQVHDVSVLAEGGSCSLHSVARGVPAGRSWDSRSFLTSPLLGSSHGSCLFPCVTFQSQWHMEGATTLHGTGQRVTLAACPFAGLY